MSKILYLTSNYFWKKYLRKALLHVKKMCVRFFLRGYAKYYVLFFWCIIGQVSYGQTKHDWKNGRKQTIDLCQKAKLIDEYIDKLLWEEDFSKELEGYIDEEITICESTDCGEQFIWANARKIDWKLNMGKVDSVLEKIENLYQSPLLKSARLKAYLHELSGMYYLLTGSANKLENHFMQATKLLEEHAPLDKKVGQNYEYLATFYNYASQNDSALLFSEMALNFYKNTKDTAKIISALLSKNTFYMAGSNAEAALESLLAAKELSQNFKSEKVYKNGILIPLAMFYESQKEVGKAVEIADQAISDIEKKEKIAGRLITDLWNFYLMKGRILMRNNQVEKGLDYINKSLVLCKEEDLAPVLFITSSLFEIEAFLKLNNYELSAFRLEAIVRNASYSQNYEIYNIKILKLVRELLEKSKLRPARDFQHSLEGIIYRVIKKNEGAYNENELAAYRLLALLQTLDGQANEAITSIAKINELKDSIWSQQKNEVVSELLIKYESKEQEQEIALHYVELEKRTMQRNVLIGFCFGLLMLSAITILYFRQRRKNVAALERQVAFRTKELKATNQKLIQSNEELERFAYISSHDLKEPLRNILSFIGLIRRKGIKGDEDVKTYFNYIHQNANRMYRLLEDVLEFSKLKIAGITKKSVDVNLVVQDAQDVISAHITQKNGEIKVDTLPIIYTDGTMLFLVFKNLIENALKYNENEKPLIQISHKEDQKFHYFSVKDNGIGIEADYQVQIFEMFKRLHNKDNYEGSGIGLAICKRTVEYLGGSISLNSNLGEGSTFTFSILKTE